MSIQQNQPPLVVCGRVFTAEDMEVIRQIIQQNFHTHRSHISREVCRALGWYKPDGGLKEMSCRVALLRMHRAGLITLPPPRHPNVNGRCNICFTPQTDPQLPINLSVRELMPIELKRVTNPPQSKLWRELIHRYHYLGYTPLPGAQIRYLIYSGAYGFLLGAISFSASAWKVKPRDEWIGWSPTQREAGLHLVINNSRFLILPWVHSKNLASKVLSLCARIVPQDWQAVYNYTPVLMETFVERERFRGTCYQAANWQWVGTTKGRGKLDRYKEYKLPVKDVYLYPLQPNFREILTHS